MSAPSSPYDSPRAALLALGEFVLAAFRRLAAEAGGERGGFAAVSHQSRSDLIYGIDAAIEALILQWLEASWPAAFPVRLVMEGVDEERAFPETRPGGGALGTLIIDPIDGTREIMWDRRSAWFLAAYAPPTPASARLVDLSAAVMVELPPSFHRGYHRLSGTRGGRLETAFVPWAGPVEPVPHTPFEGERLEHGFAGFSTPIPVGKAAMGAFGERFFAAYSGATDHLHHIFDDQYLSTAGQLFFLLTGRLRIFGDLRPIPLLRESAAPRFVCHPYDVCTGLLAELAGCVLENPEGGPLDAPLDTTSPVAWIGYANPTIAARARPILARLLPELQS